ncbi:MAG TPA: hypothetical protein VD884_16785 [Ohtaekwangia sp.]|nr:hypothetical protein [Ohtaekwangia sp.]
MPKVNFSGRRVPRIDRAYDAAHEATLEKIPQLAEEGATLMSLQSFSNIMIEKKEIRFNEIIQ